MRRWLRRVALLYAARALVYKARGLGVCEACGCIEVYGRCPVCRPDD